MNHLTLPIRNLLGQPIRSALTTISVAVAVAGLVSLTGLTRGLQDSYEHGVSDSGADFIVSQRGTYSLISSSVPQDVGEVLSAVEGVDEAAGVLLNITTIDDNANIFVAGWPMKSFLWNNVQWKEGGAPSSEDTNEVVLGETIASALDKRVGDAVELQFRPFRISGILASKSVFNQNVAVIPLSALQRLLGRGGGVTLFQVRLKRPLDPEQSADIAAHLASISTEYAVSNTSEFTSNLHFVRLVKAIASVVSLVALAIASITVANTLLMAVNERTNELGVLAAVGWTPARIYGLILIEGFMISAIGGLLGVGLGMAVMAAVSKMRISAGVLEYYVTPSLILQALTWILCLGTFAAWYPAWRATRLTPAAALRRI